jgi:hypothetical protein
MKFHGSFLFSETCSAGLVLKRVGLAEQAFAQHGVNAPIAVAHRRFRDAVGSAVRVQAGALEAPGQGIRTSTPKDWINPGSAARLRVADRPALRLSSLQAYRSRKSLEVIGR